VRDTKEIVTLDTYRLHLAFCFSPFFTEKLKQVKFDVFLQFDSYCHFDIRFLMCFASWLCLLHLPLQRDRLACQWSPRQLRWVIHPATSSGLRLLFCKHLTTEE